MTKLIKPYLKNVKVKGCQFLDYPPLVKKGVAIEIAHVEKP